MNLTTSRKIAYLLTLQGWNGMTMPPGLSCRTEQPGRRPHGVELGVVGLVFASLVLGALFASGDFGSNWDEDDNRDIGVQAVADATAFLAGDWTETSRLNREHGPAFELALLAFERTLAPSPDLRAVDLMRHRATAMLFVLSCLAFYAFCRRYFQSWPLALLGMCELALHPLMFGHAFGNTSDISFVAMTSFCLFTLCSVVTTRRYAWVAAHAFASGVAVDIRVVGVFWIPVTGVVLALDSWQRPLRWRSAVRTFAAYATCASVVIVACWPYLWPAPLTNLTWAIGSMARIAYDDTLMHLGARIHTIALPWHYNLVWIAVTTPPVILGLTVLGLGKHTVAFCRAPSPWLREHALLAGVAAWLVVPLVAPMILHSVLFDSWRHHFFVYPPMVVFSLVGCRILIATASTHLEPQRVRRAATTLATAVCVWLVGTLVWLHPYEALYFNSLARLSPQVDPALGLAGRFDLDYWGLSYREGLEFLASHTTGPIRVFNLSPPLEKSAVWLASADRDRIIFVSSLAEADYFLSTYRYQDAEYSAAYGEEVFARRLGEDKILTVRRLPGMEGQGRSAHTRPKG